ncbi:MAG: HAMP domain-containing protein, partial [Gallionella sp.]
MTFKLFRLDTINKKLLLPTLLMVMLLVGALGGVLIVQQHRELTSMMESKADSLTNMLATISVQYVINYDLSALENFVKETVKDKDIAFAEYFDADAKSLTADVMKAPADTSRLMVYERNIVGTDGKVIGKIKVGYETSALDRTLRNSITIVVVSLAAVMGLLGLGLVLIVRSVARPVKNAIEIARLVTDGDLTQHIEVTSGDEVGQLLQALKDMNESLGRIIGEVRDTTES